MQAETHLQLEANLNQFKLEHNYLILALKGRTIVFVCRDDSKAVILKSYHVFDRKVVTSCFELCEVFKFLQLAGCKSLSERS